MSVPISFLPDDPLVIQCSRKRAEVFIVVYPSLEMLHEAWQVLKVMPEAVELLNWSVNPSRLFNLDAFNSCQLPPVNCPVRAGHDTPVSLNVTGAISANYLRSEVVLSWFVTEEDKSPW